MHASMAKKHRIGNATVSHHIYTISEPSRQRRRNWAMAVIVVLSLPPGPGAAADPVGPMTASNLRCGYLTSPLGIDVVRPRLSWTLQAEGRCDNCRSRLGHLPILGVPQGRAFFLNGVEPATVGMEMKMPGSVTSWQRDRSRPVCSQQCSVRHILQLNRLGNPPVFDDAETHDNSDPSSTHLPNSCWVHMIRASRFSVSSFGWAKVERRRCPVVRGLIFATMTDITEACRPVM